MSPIDIQDILERAKYSAQVGDHEETEHLLKNYLAKVPDSREARLLIGATLAKEGKLSEAADEFIALLAKDPQDLEVLNNVAVIYRRQGRYQEALDYLKEAIEIDPARAEFHYNIGNIHKQLGNFKAASTAYTRVIELEPGYVQAYNNLGTIYDQLKEYDKAYGVFRKGLALDQNNPTLHFNYGVSLEATGHLEEAANEYRAALRSKPGWFAPMNNLGIVLFKQGRHDKAITTFNQVLNVDAFNAEAYNNIGVVLTDQGRTKEAIKNYRQAIEADHRYTKAVINLERALENAGDFAEALIELEKLVKLSPDSAEVRNRLAGLYLKMERYPESLAQAEAALEWEPENVQALRIKGAVQRVLGNDNEAQACFEKILSLDPGNYAFLLDLADIHFRRKEYKEAEERIQAYLLRRPNDREAKLLLGKLYAEMGNRTHAIQVFEELSKADPNDTEALAAAADLHKKAGSLEKALRAADTLVNLQGKRATADDLSELNKSLEFYENAVNAYSSSVREMWDRNIKLMTGEEEGSGSEEDVSLLMGAAGVAHTIEEETETLFTEGVETFSGEEEEGDLVLDEDTFGEIPEEAEELRYGDPFDALVEDDGGERRTISPADFQSEAKRPEDFQAESPNRNETPSRDALPSVPAAPETKVPDSQASKLPDLPKYPEGNRGVVDPRLLVPPEEPEPPPPKEVKPPVKEPEPPPPEEVKPPVKEPEPPPPEEVKPPVKEPEPPPPEETKPPETEQKAEPAAIADAEKDLPQEDETLGEEEEEEEEERALELPAVINLLDYLKQLTEGLPKKELKTYTKGKFPAALDSVIDRLKNLTIIKQSGIENSINLGDGGDVHGSGYR